MYAPKLAYLAGIIDGEGSLDAYSGRGNSIGLRMIVSNTNVELMDWLVSEFGGSYKLQTSSVGPVRRNFPVYRWRLGRVAAIPLLEEVLPYLIVKRRKAEVWLQIAHLMTSRGRIAMSTREAQLRRALLLEIRGV